MFTLPYTTVLLAVLMSTPAMNVIPVDQSAASVARLGPVPDQELDAQATGRKATPRIAAQEFPAEQVPLAQGVFLVAKPHIEDPRFRQTVILIVGHDEWGSIGLVINRPSDVPLQRLLPDWKDRTKSEQAEQYVYYGGPVEINLLHFLIRSPSRPQLGVPVLEDVYLLAEEAVLDVLSGDKDASTILHAYVGYAGWSVGQLAREIARGDWYVVKGDAASLFENSPIKLWRKLIRVLSGQWV